MADSQNKFRDFSLHNDTFSKKPKSKAQIFIQNANYMQIYNYMESTQRKANPAMLPGDDGASCRTTRRRQMKTR